jgi:hypothetical protein
MPIHDWTRVDAGSFHDFHQVWTVGIRNALNAGALPAGYFAMADQSRGGPIPDVITLQQREMPHDLPGPSGGVAVADAPPRAKFITSVEVEPVAVGDRLPDLPIFLDPDTYVPAPLESTYEAAWSMCPQVVKDDVLGLGS